MAENYKVLSQERVLDISGGGAPIEAWEIRFETVPSGVQSWVRVPVADYTPAHVAEVLTADAGAIEAVHAGES